MGMADITEVLYNDFLRHNPANPAWFNRDRLVLSNGHGSMLLYAALHLSGYDLTLDDIKQFRQLHSKTPGHPEYAETPGIETTTGPLGQGVANAVGMALAEKLLAEQFNRPEFTLVDHHTYVFLGDGCMMEGISHEACSLAGTLQLGKLIAIYDDNNISIDGCTDGWFTDNTPQRFEAYGWHVLADVDGHDADAVHAALQAARNVTDRPTLICAKTTIGQGAPNKAGSHDCHGAPLGEDEVAATRENLHWPHPPFVVPESIYAGWDAKARGAQLESEWQALWQGYQQAHPELAKDFARRLRQELPQDWATHCQAYLDKLNREQPQVATRKASMLALEGLGPMLPEFIGGSADLTPSNNTFWSGSKAINGGHFDGNYLSFGVREFAMVAITNGITLHGGLLPYSATFLIFSDYARNALRMSALMKLRNIFVFTHDSIGVGEDGPTHQPVEQTASLRLIPHMDVWRPCDAVESFVAWKQAVERLDGPSSLLFTRHGVPFMQRSAAQIEAINRGAYVLSGGDSDDSLILMATGSEVQLAMQAAEILRREHIGVRVVSMPCVELFERQDAAYREQVLPAHITRRVAIEAGVPDAWYKYVGLQGAVVAQKDFGASAPGGQLFKHFGFTVDAVLDAARGLI